MNLNNKNGTLQHEYISIVSLDYIYNLEKRNASYLEKAVSNSIMERSCVILGGVEIGAGTSVEEELHKIHLT